MGGRMGGSMGGRGLVGGWGCAWARALVGLGLRTLVGRQKAVV